MKTSRRHWIPLLAGVVLLLTGWLYDAAISELPRGNPPPALMDYYTRHHRIATTISSVGGALLMMSVMIYAANWIYKGSVAERTKR